MIKLLLSGKQLLLFMTIAWSLLIYVGYNVLTVEASTAETGDCTSISEPDDYFYCDEFDWDGFSPEFSYDKEWADEFCDASEDYAKNPKNCDKAYDLVKEKEKEQEKEEEDEGKRYVNPDGGAPLYEDELTEDEKDYYEEYKP